MSAFLVVVAVVSVVANAAAVLTVDAVCFSFLICWSVVVAVLAPTIVHLYFMYYSCHHLYLHLYYH